MSKKCEVLPINQVINKDCISEMNKLKDDSIEFILTDIPYNAVNRASNGLRVFDKESADELSFDLNTFLEEAYHVSKNSICIFCGKEQFSTIYEFFANKKGTVRPII